MNPSSTERFSARVDSYARYRPSYPRAVLDLLRAECGLMPGDSVADVGSGTGILSELLLTASYDVYAIEPNRAMREAGQQSLSRQAGFHSVDGTAESTGLNSHSVDLIVAAQAFHWFDRIAARREFVRILHPRGWVVLLWNERQVDSTPFLAAYEKLLQRYSTDYASVDHRRIDRQIIDEFFRPGTCEFKTFRYEQSLDQAGLIGRVHSSSYTPEEGQPEFELLMHGLKALFDRFESGGRVSLLYDTKVYYGRLDP